MNRYGEKAAGIVLAAGESSRMGGIKQLLPVGEETLIERVLAQVLASRLDKVILVLGHRALEIHAVVTRRFVDPRLLIVENRYYRQGMSSSIAVGIYEVEGAYDHAMIFLADMPCIPGDVIDRLLERHLTSGMSIGAIQSDGRPSHPVIFSREVYPDLKRLRGDVGARSLFPKYAESICLIQPEGAYDSIDIDTPEEYAGFERTNVEHPTSNIESIRNPYRAPKRQPSNTE